MGNKWELHVWSMLANTNMLAVSINNCVSSISLIILCVSCMSKYTKEKKEPGNFDYSIRCVFPFNWTLHSQNHTQMSLISLIESCVLA